MDEYDPADLEWRATLGTNRYEWVGDVVRQVPDFTIAMASDLLFREHPAREPDYRDFEGLLDPNTQQWRDFFDTRKVVERHLGGKRVSCVTSNVADAVAGKGRGVPPRSLRRKDKEYEVVHLLTDVDLRSKFEIKGSYLARMKNLATVNTLEAARVLQGHVRSFEGSERATVVAGRYAGSWKAARDTIKNFSASFPAYSVQTDASIIGDKIFIYPPGDHDGGLGWRVFGPLSCTALVHCVFRMVQASSCEAVIYAFGTELTILDIDVHNGSEVLCPVRESHAGNHFDLPLRSETAIGAALSIAQRQTLHGLCEACETVSVSGENVATAVRVTARYVLVNSHVVAEGEGITSNGAFAVPHRMLSKDLWLARVDGPEVAWHLRDAVVGEQVVLCYRRHSELQFVGPVSVESVSSTVLCLEKTSFMLPGMSGAAIVAMSDFALLGLYDGTTMRKALAATFTSDMYTDICSMSELGDSSHASAKPDGGSVYKQLKDRGLGKVVDSAMAAVYPLYSGDVHVGMGFSHGGKLYTTCDPSVTTVALESDARPLVFSSEDKYYVAQPDRPLDATPAVTRAPSYGEKVFVVGRDSEGEYFSSTTARVVHIGVGATVFQVHGLDVTNALPLQGGLIVAMADAAVLGVYSTMSYDARRGCVVNCNIMPARATVEVVERPESALLRIFPFVRPDTWPEGLATAVVSHPSTGESKMAEYAMIGDSAMRTLLWVRMVESGLPTSQWQDHFQKDQSNGVLSPKCQEIGLDRILRLGKGVNLAKGSKVYADLLEAVAGVIYQCETQDAFEKFCCAVGAIRESYEAG